MSEWMWNINGYMIVKQVLSKLILIILIAFGFTVIDANAQSEPYFTQYINNQLTFNPAYAGSNNMLCAQLTSRNQWVGFNGRPVTSAFTLHSPVFNEAMGTGFSFVSDRIGPVSMSNVYLDYSYKLQVNQRSYLSFGLKGGVDNFSFNKNEIGELASNDIVFQDVEDYLALNFGFGVYLVNPRYYLGIGIPRLLQNNIKNKNVGLFNHNTLYYYISAGGLFPMSDAFLYRPSFQSRLVKGAPLSMEIMNWFIYKDFAWLGAGYRLKESVNVGLQVQVNHQIRLGYIYDYGIGKFTKYTSGTHEFSISYDFRFRKTGVINPRYF